MDITIMDRLLLELSKERERSRRVYEIMMKLAIELEGEKEKVRRLEAELEGYRGKGKTLMEVFAEEGKKG
mgnify:CR=1 FL=1